MTSAELERRPQTDLQAQWGYAKALATAGTLPRAYRDKPGDVLLAMAYGEALGLHVTNVFTSVHIIDGRPSMSAELMQALIRRAGHRIRTKGDAQQATCVIVRKDDPDYAYSVTFTLDDARTAKLLPAKPDSGWAKYPGAMLLARAVSACARQACADVLAGVSYTAEELGAPMVDALPDVPPRPPEATMGRPTAAEDNAQEWAQAWQMDLAQAVELMDLEGITALGTKALAGGGAQAQELATMARQAWHDVQQQLAQQ